MKSGSAIEVLAARPIAAATASVAAGVGILTASAWLSVPFYPVPLTMQTLAVLLIGGLLGSRLGVATVASYLALGLAGAPVFHGGTGGPAVLPGPTGGYLVGFLPAAFLMGWAAPAFGPGRNRRRGLIAELAVLGRRRRAGRGRDLRVRCSLAGLRAIGWQLQPCGRRRLLPLPAGRFLKAAVAIGAMRIGEPAGSPSREPLSLR